MFLLLHWSRLHLQTVREVVAIELSIVVAEEPAHKQRHLSRTLNLHGF
jgi:hypothetical protein